MVDHLPWLENGETKRTGARSTRTFKLFGPGNTQEIIHNGPGRRTGAVDNKKVGRSHYGKRDQGGNDSGVTNVGNNAVGRTRTLRVVRNQKVKLQGLANLT